MVVSVCDAWQRVTTQGRGRWVQGHLQLSQGDPGGQANPGQRPARVLAHGDDVRGNVGVFSKTGSDINVLFDVSHYVGNDGKRRAGTVTFITARENVGSYGTGILFEEPNPTGSRPRDLMYQKTAK